MHALNRLRFVLSDIESKEERQKERARERERDQNCSNHKLSTSINSIGCEINHNLFVRKFCQMQNASMQWLYRL